MLLDSSGVRVVMPRTVCTFSDKKLETAGARFTIPCYSQIVCENVSRLAFSIPSYCPLT